MPKKFGSLWVMCIYGVPVQLAKQVQTFSPDSIDKKCDILIATHFNSLKCNHSYIYLLYKPYVLLFVCISLYSSPLHSCFYSNRYYTDKEVVDSFSYHKKLLP